MIIAFLMGAGIGLGVWAIAYGWRPATTPLADALAALHAAPVPATPEPDTAEHGWAARLGRPGAPLLRAAGLPRLRTRADLALLNRSVTVHLAEQAATALAGLVLPALVTAGLAAGGVRLGWIIPLWACLGCAVAGLLLPDVTVTAEARRRRAGFRHTLGSYLDLVIVALAGGAGVEAALTGAATVGDGWAWRRIGAALEEARLTRTPPWEPLGRLGHQLGVPELVELGAAVSLAGTEGAKVRVSLRARAAALRARALAQADADGAAATERMSLPVVALFGAFLLFLSYPALAAILTGL